MKLFHQLYNFFNPSLGIQKTRSVKVDLSSHFDNDDDSTSSSEILENSEIEQPTLTDQEIQDAVNAEIERRVLAVTPDKTHDEMLGDLDPLFDEAARLVVLHQEGSTSLIQRNLKLGYNRSGRIIDQLELAGVVGPFEGNKSREVLVYKESDLEFFIFKKGSFFDDILVNHEIYIAEKVAEIIEAREIERENELKKAIKTQILQKESLRKEKESLRDLEIKVRKELIAEGFLDESGVNESRRTSIPQDVLDIVWRRDQGKCVKCESQELIEFDHIIPFSKGGSNTPRNLQILCQKCNREKSNKIGE